MTEDLELCYRALVSRDPRFDGRFFTGVLTTGIYCRPICPARMPRRENVRFFPCAAAAEEAGFRPCRRCRPDSAPGTPEWNGTTATVSRGLRLIQQGALDEGNVSQLAARLGVGERHLSRLFEEHLGASPIAVAQTRRTHFARQLIEETDLTMAEIAFGAGFGSIRRFNALIKGRFGYTPTDLRERRPPRFSRACTGSPKRTLKAGSASSPIEENGLAGGSPQSGLTLRLSYRPPFAWEELLSFLDLRAIPGVERVDEAGYERTIILGETEGTLRVTHAPRGHALLLSVSALPARTVLSVVETVRHLFDLHAVPLAVSQHFANDPIVGRLSAETPGLRVPGAWSGFELAVRAILGQQVTVQAATTLATRLVSRLGRPLARPESLTMLFPTPEAIAEGDLFRLGMPGSRARALRELARSVASGALALDPASDPAETRAQLRALPGVGPWTVEYILMRALRDPDAFPAGDIVLRRVLSDDNEPLSEKELLRRAEPWRPWRAYAVLHLWRSAGRLRDDS